MYTYYVTSCSEVLDVVCMMERGNNRSIFPGLTPLPSHVSTGHGLFCAHNEGINTPKVSIKAIRNASR